MKTATILTIAVVGLATAIKAAEPAELIRLYEEEVLAHDLYVALGKKHPDIMPLKNIPRSEARHREAMEEILKKEGIPVPDPKAGRRFVTPGLDKTYKTWLREGRKSPVAACRVGVRLEEHDISDLRKAQTSFPAHKQVLVQLENASNNHLRAFHRNMKNRGGSYQVEVLSGKDFELILNGVNEGCGCDAACGNGCGNTLQKEAPGRGPRAGGGRGQGQNRGQNRGQGRGR